MAAARLSGGERQQANAYRLAQAFMIVRKRKPLHSPGKAGNVRLWALQTL